MRGRREERTALSQPNLSRSGFPEDMATHTRTRDDDSRLVRTFSRWLAAVAIAATATFGGLAAVHSHAASQTQQQGSSDGTGDDSSALTPSSSAPQQSFQPPVVQSGGS